MTRTVADYMVEALTQAGVKPIYGVVGDSLVGFTESLRRLKSIEWVHVRHEESAAFAAGAEAHLTGKLAVCAGSCCPGNLRLINGLYDAHRSRVPVLAIATHNPSTETPSAPIIRPNENELRALSDLLNSVERVTLFCGAGCDGAHDDPALSRCAPSPAIDAAGRQSAP